MPSICFTHLPVPAPIQTKELNLSMCYLHPTIWKNTNLMQPDNKDDKYKLLALLISLIAVIALD